MVNDAVCMRGLNDLSSMTFPVQSPSTWIGESWDKELVLDVGYPSHPGDHHMLMVV